MWQLLAALLGGTAGGSVPRAAPGLAMFLVGGALLALASDRLAREPTRGWIEARGRVTAAQVIERGDAPRFELYVVFTHEVGGRAWTASTSLRFPTRAEAERLAPRAGEDVAIRRDPRRPTRAAFGPAPAWGPFVMLGLVGVFAAGCGAVLVIAETGDARAPRPRREEGPWARWGPGS